MREDRVMNDMPGWDVEELVRRVGLALDGAARAGAYPGAPNGRIREIPDQRVIRWYASTGLIDRPFGGRGRGARYGSRHLLQLVAVKHLQAQGWPLAEIQARIAGASDAALAELAPAIPTELLAGAAPDPPRRSAAARTVSSSRAVAAPRFWATTPTTPTTPTTAVTAVTPAASAEPAGAPAARRTPSPLETLTALRLADGVLLLLPTRPDPDDLSALVEAAGPLLTVLSDRGLIHARESGAERTEAESNEAESNEAEPTEGASR
jgi:DNA-binding transcriptional MerR regulator